MSVVCTRIIRQFSYDTSQRLWQIFEPERAPITFSYYGGSHLVKTKTVGNRAPITYTYDSLSRPYQVLLSNSNDNITYGYDSNGKVVSISTPLNAVSSRYDPNGNKTNDTLSIDGYSFSVDYGYDNIDRAQTVTYPDSSAFAGTALGSRNTLTYTYDGLNRVSAIKDSFQNILNSVAYNPNGMFSSISYANGVTWGMSLTNDNWPYQLSLNGANSSISLQYGYDLKGNILSIADLANSAYSQNFNYDGLDRMISAYPGGASALPTGAQSTNTGGAIGYTNTGDILTYTEFAKNQTTLSYDSTTQLLMQSSGPQTKLYQYDDYGQMKTNSIYNFNYDPNFNMTSVTSASTNANIAAYTYDGNDLRIKKVLGSGATTYYVYGGGHLVMEATPGKSIKEYFYLGSNLVGTRSVSANVPTYKYYHFNPIASTVAQTDSSKVVTQEHYNAYGGELLPNTNFTSNIDVRFAGHVSDDETNLVYMKGRYFDPSIGRFITPDPEDFSPTKTQSFNKYAYANNNPLKFVDPNGHDPVDFVVRYEYNDKSFLSGALLLSPNGNLTHPVIIQTVQPNAKAITAFRGAGTLDVVQAGGAIWPRQQ